MLLLLVALNSIFLLSTNAFAQDFSGKESISFFGGSDLDYWRDGMRQMKPPLVMRPATVATPTTQAPQPNKAGIRSRDSDAFDWRSYEDPTNDVFWDDGGDFIPARPFREAAANPTPENVAKYLAWMQRKIDVSAKFEREIKQQSAISAIKKEDRSDLIDWKKLTIIYFYQSSCQHCQRSAPVVEELKTKGAKIIPVQLDYKANPPLHDNSTPYEGDLARNYKVSATPMWVVNYNSKTKTLYGEKGASELIQ